MDLEQDRKEEYVYKTDKQMKYLADQENVNRKELKELLVRCYY